MGERQEFFSNYNKALKIIEELRALIPIIYNEALILVNDALAIEGLDESAEDVIGELVKNHGIQMLDVYEMHGGFKWVYELSDERFESLTNDLIDSIDKVIASCSWVNCNRKREKMSPAAGKLNYSILGL